MQMGFFFFCVFCFHVFVLQQMHFPVKSIQYTGFQGKVEFYFCFDFKNILYFHILFLHFKCIRVIGSNGNANVNVSSRVI